MEQRDLIMEEINQISRALGLVFARAMGLGGDGKVSEGIEIVQQGLKSELDIDLDKIGAMNENEFISYLKNENRLHFTHIEQLGKFLEFMGDSQTELGHAEKARALYEKALIAFRFASEKQQSLSFETYYSLERLKKNLSGS